MALLPRQFNAHDIDPASIGGQLPVSDAKGHLVIITESEFKPSKNNPNNGFVEFTLQIVDGPNVGATGAWRLNLFHENAQTVDIANRQLSALCHVTGQMMISDTTQLHNIPFRAVVVEKPYKNNEGIEVKGSEVKGVLDVNGEKPKRNSAPAPQQSAPTFAQSSPVPAPTQQTAPVWGQQTTPAPSPAPAPWGPK